MDTNRDFRTLWHSTSVTRASARDKREQRDRRPRFGPGEEPGLEDLLRRLTMFHFQICIHTQNLQPAGHTST